VTSKAMKERRPVNQMQQSGIILKSAREIELMRTAGRAVHDVLSMMREHVKPGITTAQLNELAEAFIEDSGGEALFKGVENPQARFPFPAALCTSVNEELVHGVPGDRSLQDGDIIGIDCGVKLAGYCGDSASTFAVGTISPEVDRLLKVTKQSLAVAITCIKPGRRWSEVAREIQSYVEGEGFSVVREFVGHGIGRDLHEEPKVPNYWDKRQKQPDFVLQENMVIAVEPMVNIGSAAVEFGDKDGWVVVTRDRKYCAHFEHTLAVTKAGADLLTDGH